MATQIGMYALVAMYSFIYNKYVSETILSAKDFKL